MAAAAEKKRQLTVTEPELFLLRPAAAADRYPETRRVSVSGNHNKHPLLAERKRTPDLHLKTNGHPKVIVSKPIGLGPGPLRSGSAIGVAKPTQCAEKSRL